MGVIRSFCPGWYRLRRVCDRRDVAFASPESTDASLLAARPPQGHLAVSPVCPAGPGTPPGVPRGASLDASVFKRLILLDCTLVAGRSLVSSSSCAQGPVLEP